MEKSVNLQHSFLLSYNLLSYNHATARLEKNGGLIYKILEDIEVEPPCTNKFMRCAVLMGVCC